MATSLRYWSAQAHTQLPCRCVRWWFSSPSKTANCRPISAKNSLLRLKPGDDAEVVFNALPAGVPRQTDQYFTCRARRFLSGAGGIAITTVAPGTDGVLGTIELTLNDDIDALPDGIYAQVAVYSWPFQPCFGDAESAAKNDQLDALSLFGSLRGRGDYGTLLLVRTNYFCILLH